MGLMDLETQVSGWRVNTCGNQFQLRPDSLFCSSADIPASGIAPQPEHAAVALGRLFRAQKAAWPAVKTQLVRPGRDPRVFRWCA